MALHFKYSLTTGVVKKKVNSGLNVMLELHLVLHTTQLYTSLRALLRQLFYPASAGYWKSTYHCVLLHGWVT